MEKDFGITIGDDGLPTQKFNGKDFKLYPREHYFSRGTKRMHVQVWESVNGKTPKGFHIHHKDGNTWNNSIDNLECIEGKKHLSIHGKERFKNNPEWAKAFHAKGIEKAKVKENEDRRSQHLALIEAELKLTPEQRAGRNKARAVLAAAFGLIGGGRGLSSSVKK